MERNDRICRILARQWSFDEVMIQGGEEEYAIRSAFILANSAGRMIAQLFWDGRQKMRTKMAHNEGLEPRTVV